MQPDFGSKFDLVKLARFAIFVISLVAFGTPNSIAQANRQLTQGPARPQTNSQKRIALVIGNGAYKNAPALKNPPNDAALVAATLRQLGFEVKNGSNLTQREMKQRIREFGQTLRANGGVGLFYFAGHGVQAKGHNYLMPIDADIQTEADLEDVAVDVNYVLNLMDDAQNALNIVILDACRNNPFARGFRSAQDGLAQIKAPTGTLIAYATAPDSVAADGAGANSPYSQELVKQIQTSGVLLETMFRRVTEQVSARTGGRQEPWFSANVKGDFYFNAGPTNSSTTSLSVSNSATIETARTSVDPTAIELSYWESIKNSTNVDDFKAYLEKYPNGQFAALAKNRINSLEAASKSESRSSTSGDAAELAFWDSIKDSKNVADYQAYLKKYPNGTFADLATSRVATLETEAKEKERAKEEAEKLAPNTHAFNAGSIGGKGSLQNFTKGTLTISPRGVEFQAEEATSDEGNLFIPCAEILNVEIGKSKSLTHINLMTSRHEYVFVIGGRVATPRSKFLQFAPQTRGVSGSDETPAAFNAIIEACGPGLKNVRRGDRRKP